MDGANNKQHTSMTTKDKIKRIENTGICLASSNDHGDMIGIVRSRAAQEDGGELFIEKAHLYMVTLTLKRFSDTGHPLYPSVSTYFVIAQDEENAIAQVESNPWPDLNYVPASKRANVTGVATRIPVQIRGWGAHTF